MSRASPLLTNNVASLPTAKEPVKASIPKTLAVFMLLVARLIPCLVLVLLLAQHRMEDFLSENLMHLLFVKKEFTSVN